MPDRVKVAIVGSGPAGLSAAARAAQLGMSHVLLEKTDHLSDTIYKYQKGKHVMATPSNLVLRSDLDFEAGKRETILGIWNEQTGGHSVNVAYNAEIASITGEKGDFLLKTRAGHEFHAETVVLAIGTQGNPNTVRCPVGEGAVVQYQLDDPGEYVDEHIVVIGAGDAGIENAMGLAADPQQRNTVTIINRSADFATAKAANVAALRAMEAEGRLIVRTETTSSAIDLGEITFDTRDGEVKARCDRVIARMGSAPPRAFVEGICARFEDKDGKKAIVPGTGVEFTSPDRVAYPKLSPTFESTVPGVHVIGALAGYPLIKHCMNQGHDVIEFLNGNRDLKPADEPILAAKFAVLPGRRSVDEWLETFRANVVILNELSPLQMRELMLDSTVAHHAPGEVIFVRNDPGSSMFAIAEGSVAVEVNPADPSITVPIGQGSIFGEVGLISGRRRGSRFSFSTGIDVAAACWKSWSYRWAAWSSRMNSRTTSIGAPGPGRGGICGRLPSTTKSTLPERSSTTRPPQPSINARIWSASAAVERPSRLASNVPYTRNVYTLLGSYSALAITSPRTIGLPRTSDVTRAAELVSSTRMISIVALPRGYSPVLGSGLICVASA
ncbi:NAD(P)-binding domain-containing protein [Leptolyngbya sp. 15MV]|nr:NAD(P)-binding domain-containing protein [Leptolyngbya sp. 15MV]